MRRYGAGRSPGVVIAMVACGTIALWCLAVSSLVMDQMAVAYALLALLMSAASAGRAAVLMCHGVPLCCHLWAALPAV